MSTVSRQTAWIALPAALLAAAGLVSYAGSDPGSSPGSGEPVPRIAPSIEQVAQATPLTVAQAIAGQTGSSQSVRGYVVGQPTAADSVLTSGFTGDTAIALADSAAETNPGAMIYVQVSSAYRGAFGLQSNPGLIRTRLDVTGTLTAYFAHPGLKSPTSITPAGTSTPAPTTTSPVVPTPTTTSNPGTYYAAANGKTGNDLHKALHQIISSNVTALPYGDVWDALKVTDQDPKNSGNVILLYSGTSRSKTLNGGDADDWNREHVWAKSHGDFGTATGPGTDLHHLRPEDVTVNSDRSNKDFDDGGSESGEAPGNFTDSDSWEARDAVKGDVARMIFYMAVRYDGGDGFADLTLDESTTGGTAPRFGKLSTLLEWNAQDPPDSFEQRRNDAIYQQFQHNRNPFIDHPEWAEDVFS